MKDVVIIFSNNSQAITVPDNLSPSLHNFIVPDYNNIKITRQNIISKTLIKLSNSFWF